MSTPSRALLTILALSLVVRLALWVRIAATDEQRFWESDTYSYHRPAMALVEIGEFAVSPQRPGVAETVRTPGYPAFLAAIYSVVGESTPIAVFVQIVLGVGTVALTFEIGSLLCGPRVGLWSAGLLALDPVSLALHEVLMSETLFAFLLAAAVANGLRLLHGRSSPLAAGVVGVLIALATLVRPVAYFLGPPIALLLAVCVHGWSPRQRAGAAVAMLVPLVAIVGGWQLRNYARTGHAELTQVADDLALLSRGAAIIAWRDGVSLERAQRQMEAQTRPPSPAADLAEVSRRRGDQGWALIRAHPFLLALTSMTRAVRMLCGPGEHRLAALLGQRPSDAPGLDLQRLSFDDFLLRCVDRPTWLLGLFVFAAGYLAVVNLAIARWLWLSVRGRAWRAADVFVWSILVYFLAFGMASSRFRMPIMPLLVVYAAQGLQTRVRSAATSSSSPRRLA